MAKAGRTVLGVVYCSLTFGIVLAPYFYIVLGVLAHLVPWVVPVVVSLLVLATCVVMVSFTKGSTRLSIAVSCVAFVWICGVLGLFANFGLPEKEQYWVVLSSVIAVSTLVAMGIVVLRPPSRIERFISSRVSEGRYRVIGYVLLAILLLAASWKLRQYFDFSHPVY